MRKLPLAIIFVLALYGFFLGWQDGSAVVAISHDEERQLFDAVDQYLKQARLPEQDLPKKIISVLELGRRKYRVHMEMRQGEAWFEVTWTGEAWAVKGLQPPAGQPGKSQGAAP